jgi:hypothetical protein
MKSRKWLKNFNPVSKKSGERQVDPLLTVANGGFAAAEINQEQANAARPTCSYCPAGPL